MSKSLDEYSQSELETELHRRKVAHASNLCDYCGRDALPSCRFTERHARATTPAVVIAYADDLETKHVDEAVAEAVKAIKDQVHEIANGLRLCRLDSDEGRTALIEALTEIYK